MRNRTTRYIGLITATTLLLGSLAHAAEIRLECEDFGGPWREQRNIPGYSGRGFVVSNAEGIATEPMSLDVEIPEPGTYYVWARGWEGGGSDRRWRVQVGDVLLDITHQALRANRFAWQPCGEVELAEGDVEIHLVDAGTSFEVADAIMLTTDAEHDPTEEERRWTVLDPERARSMVFDEIMARTRAHAAAMPVPETLEDWRESAPEVQRRVREALHLDRLPEPCPLNAKVLGSAQRDGYRIERVTFESRPDMIVTANVYVPDGDGPFPLVLCPVGHWGNAKNEETPAARNRGLAKLGYITITYDPFGQGERNVSGNSHQEAWRLSLTGRSNMTMMVYDTIRALDYMVTRDDFDSALVACTGASGGGLNTLYFSLVEERLDVAVPTVYITQWEDFLGTGAGHCPCSHVPGLGRFTDMGEMTALFAPKPQMYLDAADDPQFLTSGAQRAEAQARVVYDLFDAGDDLRLHTFPGGHDYGQGMRETLYGFLALHFLDEGDGSPIPEPADVMPPPAMSELWCCESGKVPAEATTVRQAAETWARAAIEQLPSPGAANPATLRAALVEVVNPPDPTDPPALEHVDTFEHDGLTVRRMKLHVQPGITLPVLIAPAKSGAPVVVMADASPDPTTAENLLREANAAGLMGVYVSPRGYGETAWDEHVICTDNLLLGDSILGQRALDLVAARRALADLPGMADAPVSLLATGADAGLCGLFAQAMWGEFAAAAIGPTMESYADTFGPGIPLMGYVNRILEVADIPHVRALAAQRPLADVESVADALAWLATHE